MKRVEQTKIAEQIQVLRMAIQSLQADQWECGYDDARAQRISALRIELNRLLAE